MNSTEAMNSTISTMLSKMLAGELDELSQGDIVLLTVETMKEYLDH